MERQASHTIHLHHASSLGMADPTVRGREKKPDRTSFSLRRLSTHKNTGIEHRTPAGVRPSFQASQVNQHSAPAARSHACTSTLARPCPRSYAAHYKTRIRPDLSKKGGKGSKRKKAKKAKKRKDASQTRSAPSWAFRISTF